MEGVGGGDQGREEGGVKPSSDWYHTPPSVEVPREEGRGEGLISLIIIFIVIKGHSTWMISTTQLHQLPNLHLLPIYAIFSCYPYQIQYTLSFELKLLAVHISYSVTTLLCPFNNLPLTKKMEQQIHQRECQPDPCVQWLAWL